MNIARIGAPESSRSARSLATWGGAQARRPRQPQRLRRRLAAGRASTSQARRSPASTCSPVNRAGRSLSGELEAGEPIVSLADPAHHARRRSTPRGSGLPFWGECHVAPPHLDLCERVDALLHAIVARHTLGHLRGGGQSRRRAARGGVAGIVVARRWPWRGCASGHLGRTTRAYEALAARSGRRAAPHLPARAARRCPLPCPGLRKAPPRGRAAVAE